MYIVHLQLTTVQQSIDHLDFPKEKSIAISFSVAIHKWNIHSATASRASHMQISERSE